MSRIIKANKHVKSYLGEENQNHSRGHMVTKTTATS